jgi:DNA-binding NarL/FixJ family response regulator
MLGSKGRFAIAHAATLSEARKQLHQLPGDARQDGLPDVILLDLDLPDSKGLNTLRKVHELQPSIPIIVLSGNEARGIAVEALRNHARDYLVKGRVDAHLLSQALLRQVEL